MKDGWIGKLGPGLVVIAIGPWRFGVPLLAGAWLACSGSTPPATPGGSGGGGSGEPVYNAATDFQVQQDSFERYANIISMPTYPPPLVSWKIDTVNKQLLHDATAHSGLQYIRATYPQSSSQVSVTWETQPHGNRYTPTSRPVVMQFWFRISAGGGPGASGMKWFEAWNSALNDRWQVGPFTGTDANPIFGWQGFKNELVGSNRAHQPVGPYWSQINDHQWHRWTVWFKPNTSWNYPNPSSRDGFLRVFIDGQMIIDIEQSAVNVTPPGGTKVWCIQDDVDAIPNTPVDYMAWPNVQNGLNRPTWSIDYDDLWWWAQP